MKKLAIVFAVSAAALMGGSSAYAADNAVKSKPSTDAAQSRIGTNPGLPRNRRPISARNTAIGTGTAITTAIATGTTVITGPTTGATTTTPRARTATTVRAITAAAPA